MKNLLFLLVTALLLLPATLPAQTKLPDSRRSSAGYQIYTIGKKQLQKIYLKEETITEDMLGNHVASFLTEEKWPKLPRGNYMVVGAIEEKLSFCDYTVDDLYFKIIPAEQFMLCLHDSLGTIITTAQVKSGSKTLTYDKATQTYGAKSLKNGAVIEINNNGVYHYLEIEKENNHYRYARKNIFGSVKRKAIRLWHNIKHNIKALFSEDYRYYYSSRKDKYTGFVVFSKPRYKPGETVKFKAYMAQLNGKPYNKPVDIRLYNYYPHKIDTVLTNLAPYRPGMYQYEFTLTSNLDLRLDVDYTIALDTGNERYNTLSDTFRYEDYELKGIRFAMETDKEEYVKGDSALLKFKVTDENDMAVYDGKIDLVVRSKPISFNAIKNCDKGFVPDILWQHTLQLDGLANKEIVVPDSVFPAGISLPYRVNATYLSSSNEKQEANLDLFRQADDYVIEFSLNQGMLTIEERSGGKSLPVMADLSIEGENSEVILRKSVRLPHTLPLPWCASDVTVKTEHTVNYFFTDEIKEHQLTANFYRHNDSIYLTVDNPAHIPFWYTIRKNKHEIARSYTRQLNYAVKDDNKGYSMQINYQLGQTHKTIEKTVPFIRKNISIEVNTPTTVYPGQKADVKVTVKDKKGKPVKGADITAYAFTAKFKNYTPPHLAIYGKARYARQFTNQYYEGDKNSLAHVKTPMTWHRWKSTLSLDTIAYYHFLFPETYYVYTEPTADRTTLISPYVVMDGVLQEVNMLWIDERLYYTSTAEHQEVYSFPIEPGNHKLKFRTFDREVAVHNIAIKEGARNIFSFNIKQPYKRLEAMNSKTSLPLVISSQPLDKKKRKFPTEEEKEYLTEHLISVDNNFGTITLPNLHHQKIAIPAYLKSGDTYFYLNHTPKTRYDYTLKEHLYAPILTGPFPRRSAVNGVADVGIIYRDKNELVSLIELEGGNKYTVYPGYQKIKSWDKPPFIYSTRATTYTRNFRQDPVTVKDILDYTKDKLHAIMQAANGPAEVKKQPDKQIQTPCTLNLYLGTDGQGKPVKPVLVFLVPEDEKLIADYQLHYGATRRFTNLPSGTVNVSLVFADSTSHTRQVTLQPGGQNFLYMDTIKYPAGKETGGQAFRIFNRHVTKTYHKKPYLSTAIDTVVAMPPPQTAKLKARNKQKGIVSGTVFDSYGEPVIGANVSIAGTTLGTITNLDGYFELSGGSSGDKIQIAYIGFITHTAEYEEGCEYTIRLKEDSQMLDEVAVVGYGVVKRKDLTGSIAVESFNATLAGSVAGVYVRGTTASDKEKAPLVLVDGLPYNGDMGDIDPSTILSVNILKDASATAVYGARAAHGVIMIQTNKPRLPQPEPGAGDLPLPEAGNSMRRNFKDDAFWQPRLRTDGRGEAHFEITYPDDITNWKAYFIAIGGKKQTDKYEMNIHSLKALTASLATPRFAIRGDSICAVGKITNHLGDTISVQRNMDVAGKVSKDQVKLAATHVESIPVTAEKGDSLKVAYSMQLANGYFDGEERSFPILEKGMLQTHGQFKVINDTATHTFDVNPRQGKVTIHAESSSLEMFLREIEKVDSYPYMCNEQMASKIKVLLARKAIARMFNLEFKEDKKIVMLIKRLKDNMNAEGKWGWWNKDKTETWISNQVISALMDAGKAGYNTPLDTYELSYALTKELQAGLSNLKLSKDGSLLYAKQELLERLLTLKRIDAKIEFRQYLEQIDTQLPNRSVTDRLKVMETMAAIGLKDQINKDSLMHDARYTMLGSMFWGDLKEETPFYWNSLPYQNNINNTLAAYRLLKALGGYEKELEKVRNYFFEHRQGGSWSNTYESSRIIETIMPDLLKEGQTYQETVMMLNGRPVTQFPFTEEMELSNPVTISKKGTMPVFLTVYQQAWNPHPEAESTKGFKVKSAFTASGDTLANLTAGKVTQLEVTVVLDADAQYIQIEVPVPAGCSYETKRAGNYRKEVHREHYKDKVVIFSNKLSKGEHRFVVDLIPRYTGRYTLNPAKAELMYFPVFYGNEELKRIEIKKQR